jgi:hypothetical protein
MGLSLQVGGSSPGACGEGVGALAEQADRVHQRVDTSVSLGAREPDVIADGHRHVASVRWSSSALCTPEADASTTSTLLIRAGEGLL